MAQAPGGSGSDQFAIEEILRWSSPLLYFRRNAIQEMAIDGTVIEPADIVSLWALLTDPWVL